LGALAEQYPALARTREALHEARYGRSRVSDSQCGRRPRMPSRGSLRSWTKSTHNGGRS
jgi:hypothetical protein